MKKMTAEDVLYLMNRSLAISPESALTLMSINAMVDLRNGRLKTNTLEGDATAAESGEYVPRNALAFVIFGESYCYFRMSPAKPKNDAEGEDDDAVEYAQQLGGVGVFDAELLERLDQTKSRTVAILSLGRDAQGDRVVQVHRHPDIDFREALGVLKSAAHDLLQGREQ